MATKENMTIFKNLHACASVESIVISNNMLNKVFAAK